MPVSYTHLDVYKRQGMENIQTVTEVNGNTTIAFEDNVYRGTYRGIGKAIDVYKRQFISYAISY